VVVNGDGDANERETLSNRSGSVAHDAVHVAVHVHDHVHDNDSPRSRLSAITTLRDHVSAITTA
jgi:hypothetical protein